MSQYNITEVSEDFNEWQSKFGPMHTYTVRAVDPAGETRTFQMNRKPESGPPQTGEVDASEKPAKGDFPPTLKINYTEQGGGGGGATQTAAAPAPSPSRQKAIQRQHSQEMALRLIAVTGDASALNTDDEKIVTTYLNSTVKRLADWFDADVDRVAKGE
jgi:hypothetical protein